VKARKLPTRYLTNYTALYGDGMPVAPRVKKRRLVSSEEQEQILLSAWLTKHNIMHHHSPNGGLRNAREGAKFKRMGVRAGWPDVHLPYARKGYYSLFIEVKRKVGGQLTDSQKYCLEELNKLGHLAVVARGADEAIEIIKQYFDMI